MAIAVQTNGDLRVQETQVINFTSGVFHEGFAEISTVNTDGITNVTVSENGTAYRPVSSSCCLNKGEVAIEPGDSGVINVTWGMGATENQTRTFVLAYTAHGVIRRYAVGNEFQWNAISPACTTTRSASRPSPSTCRPWRAISQADYLVQPEFAGVPMDGQPFQRTSSAPPGWPSKASRPSDGVQIVVQFPPNTGWRNGAPPGRPALIQQTAWNNNVKPWLDLGLLTLGLLHLAGRAGRHLSVVVPARPRPQDRRRAGVHHRAAAGPAARHSRYVGR